MHNRNKNRIIKVIVIATLLISFNCSYGQCIKLNRDTVTFYEIGKINEDFTFKILEIGNSFFNMNNLPFNGFKCTFKIDDGSDLRRYDYLPITDMKSIEKFLDQLGKKKANQLERKTNSDLGPLLDCLLLEGGRFVYIRQRVVIDYLIVDCRDNFDKEGKIHCSDIINSNQIPVILKIEKSIDK